MTESPTPDTCGEENSEAPKSGLDALPGLDYALGLKQLSGNVEVYEDLLRKFVTGTESDLAAIAQHLDAIELDKVRRLAHRLRGAAGALGAMRLHELAGNLEDSIRKQEPATAIEIAAGALAMEFKRLSSAMPKN
jgi:two-component system sensor histidine kinase/response regulator